MCLEYRTNGILPHPLPPEKNTTTTEALRNIRSKLNQNYIVTVTLSLTRARFMAASLPIKKEAAATKTRLNRKTVNKD